MKISKFFVLLILIFILAPAQVVALDLTLRQQSMIRMEDREMAMEEIRNRCTLEEAAIIQYQERVQVQGKNQFYFSDIEHHWGVSQITYSYQWGIINGYPDGTFKPDKAISGIEGDLMLLRMMNCVKGEEIEPVSPGAVNLEIVPALNRMDFLQMFALKTGISSSAVSEQAVLFLDQHEIPDTMLGYVNTMRNIGLIFGHEGYLKPNEAITRAEASSIIARYISLLGT